MAGYSGTPLPTKLGIKPGSRVAWIDAPDEYPAILGELPATVVQVGARGRDLDVAVLFVRSSAALQRRFGPAAKRLSPAGGLWIAWPKKASGVATDLTEDVVRRIGLASGLVDNKVCAIDATWSGLRFVVRIADRPARQASDRSAR